MHSQNPRPSTWQLLRIWASIGLQSFGGGASTTYLIYRTFIDENHWILPEEYNLFWNLSSMSPGINLAGLAILIGRKLGGARGILVSLVGLLIPSAAITCLLTIGFLSVERLPAVQAMLRGVVPATAGLTFVVGIKYAKPLVKEIKVEGWLRLSLSLLIPVATLLAIVLFQVAIPLVILGSALLGMALFTRSVVQPAATSVPLAHSKQPSSAITAQPDDDRRPTTEPGILGETHD